ncbi:hypothetical protein [Corynebacterium pseudokroppenstedtii]|uniref:hypothetical protein n=1 Tax=Corynebacterium pseudokroppenstedtii TaxID=2804917 RepID=UPI00307A4ECC
MSRSRSSAEKAGAAFESVIGSYLARELDGDFIERRRLTAANDWGDITGVRDSLGQRLRSEVKNYGGRITPGPWVE